MFGSALLRTAPAAVSTPSPGSAADTLRVAGARFERGEYEQAIRLYQGLLDAGAGASPSELAQARFFLARSHMLRAEQGGGAAATHYQSAHRLFAELIESAPADSSFRLEARFRLGECSYRLGNWQQAATELQQYLDQNPFPAGSAPPEYARWALYMLGDAELRRGRFAAAATALRSSLTRFAEGPVAEFSTIALAQALAGQDDLPGAIAALAPLREGTSAPAQRGRLLLAAFHRRRGELDQAVTVLEALGRIDSPAPGIAEGIRFETALTRIGQRRYDQASTLLAALIEEFPASPQLAARREHLAYCHLQLGNAVLAGIPADAGPEVQRERYAQAMSWFQRIADAPGAGSYLPEALRQIVEIGSRRAELETGEARTAVMSRVDAALQRLQEHYRDDPRTPHATAVYAARRACGASGPARDTFLRQATEALQALRTAHPSSALTLSAARTVAAIALQAARAYAAAEGATVEGATARYQAAFDLARLPQPAGAEESHLSAMRAFALEAGTGLLRRLEEAGSRAAADQAYGQLRAACPAADLAPALYSLASAHLSAGGARAERGRALLSVIIRDFPASAYTRVAQIELARHAGNWAEVIRRAGELRTAADAGTGAPAGQQLELRVYARLALGMGHLRSGALAEARTALDQAAQLLEGAGDAFNQRRAQLGSLRAELQGETTLAAGMAAAEAGNRELAENHFLSVSRDPSLPRQLQERAEEALRRLTSGM